jgi:hypothetical protein
MIHYMLLPEELFHKKSADASSKSFEPRRRKDAKAKEF